MHSKSICSFQNWGFGRYLLKLKTNDGMWGENIANDIDEIFIKHEDKPLWHAICNEIYMLGGSLKTTLPLSVNNGICKITQ